MVLVVDTSFSVGKKDFNNNVIPFLRNLVTDPLLNVWESGTHVGLILFSSEERTKTKLDLGKIKDANKLEQYIDNLKWEDVSGRYTRTDLGLKLANEVRRYNSNLLQMLLTMMLLFLLLFCPCSVVLFVVVVFYWSLVILLHVYILQTLFWCQLIKCK